MPKPKPIQTITLSPVVIFVVFIAFSIISSMWTNIGTLALKQYLPDPTKSNLMTATITAVGITALFAVMLSYIGISFSKFT